MLYTFGKAAELRDEIYEAKNFLAKALLSTMNPGDIDPDDPEFRMGMEAIKRMNSLMDRYAELIAEQAQQHDEQMERLSRIEIDLKTLLNNLKKEA